MEIEASTQQEMAKKLWHMVRAVFYMIRKSISKSKFMIDLQLLFKRGNKLATKAITNLLLHHHHHHLSSAFSCRSSDSALSFISPREYEFSCSNSPAGGTFYPLRLHKRHHHQLHLHHLSKSSKLYSDVSTVSAVHKMLEMLNNEAAAAGVEASPLTALPGFGKSPMVRQLRITDSPFPLKDDGDSQVDRAAEEFIKRFYKDLKQQKISAVDSPYHGMWGR